MKYHIMYHVGVVTDNSDDASAAEGATAEATLTDEDYFKFRNAHKVVLLSPGNIISMTVLNQKGTFRTKTASGMNGKNLMAKASQFSQSCTT